MSSILALSKVMTAVVYGFPLVGVGVAIILASSIFTMLPLVSNQSAFGGTFPGENGKIAFSSDRDGQNEIYIMNASDGSGQSRLTNNTAVDGSPSWSPDGTKIAFHSNRDGNLEIYVMNASDGSNPTRLTNNTANDFDPSWSPDGTKIAFSSDRDDPNYEIYVMNAADGSNVKRLTNNPTFDEFASWSPDGEKIAFSSDRGGYCCSEIYVMNAADGSNVKRLTNNNNTANDFEPSWSPDGTKIAFESDIDSDDYIETNYEIYIMNASDGSGQSRLTTDPAFDVSPTWSPDGTKIAFSSDRDGQNEIYIMNASDGSGQSRLTNNIRVDFFPDWGPATEPPEEDTTPPTLTVPDDIIVEANSTEGAQITYTVTAQNNVDGNATLEDDGSTVTQDDVRGNITISCDPASGSVFPIGNTTVQCSATDEAGNTATQSFTVTVNPPISSPPPPVPNPLKQAIGKLISTIQNLDDNVPQSVKTSLTAALKQVSNILGDDNPSNDNAVCGKLGAFINQVNANERRDTLTADQADELRTQAEDIRNQLDC